MNEQDRLREYQALRDSGLSEHEARATVWPNLSLKEVLAAIEHERWADWQLWLHNLAFAIIEEVDGVEGKSAGPGSLVIPKVLVDKWERQAYTPYLELSERERASDLLQVDRYWDLVRPMARVQLLVDLIEQAVHQVPFNWSVWTCRYCYAYDSDRGEVSHHQDCPVTVIRKFLE